MIEWIKNLLGLKGPSAKPLVLTDPVKTEDEVQASEQPTELPPKKPAKKTSRTTVVKKPKKEVSVDESVDLDSMSKKELLDEANKRGIKVNSSLKKAEIIEHIKNA